MCFSLWKISLCQFCWLLLVLSSARNVCCYSQPDLTATTPTTATTTASTLSSIRAPDNFQFTAANVVELKDTLNKRNVKVDADLSASSSAKAKSYDPPPEFYRGPGSTGAGSSSASSSSSTDSGAYSANAYGNRDSLSPGYGTKPFSFPDKYGTNSGSNLANEYNSWQLLRGGNLRDRISVGHYGSANHGTAHAASGYAYEGRPYVESQHNDYGGGYYAGTAPGGGAGGGGGYYGSTGDGIRFDVYGTKGHGAGSGSGHYAGSSHYDGSGGEYSYTYPELHESPGHGHGKDQAEHKALLAKSFLIPLASAAVLGIAAALVSNPLLLQLGTVSAGGLVPVVGKRKRRAAVGLNAEESSEKAHTLAYRAYRPTSSARI